MEMPDCSCRESFVDDDAEDAENDDGDAPGQQGAAGDAPETGRGDACRSLVVGGASTQARRAEAARSAHADAEALQAARAALAIEPPLAKIETVTFSTEGPLADALSRPYAPARTFRGEESGPELRFPSAIICPTCKRKTTPPENDAVEEICPGHASSIKLFTPIMYPDAERSRSCVKMLKTLLSLNVGGDFRGAKKVPASAAAAEGTAPGASDTNACKTVKRAPICPLCIIKRVRVFGMSGDARASSADGGGGGAACIDRGMDAASVAQEAFGGDAVCRICASHIAYVARDVKPTRIVSETSDEARRADAVAAAEAGAARGAGPGPAPAQKRRRPASISAGSESKPGSLALSIVYEARGEKARACDECSAAPAPGAGPETSSEAAGGRKRPAEALPQHRQQQQQQRQSSGAASGGCGRSRGGGATRFETLRADDIAVLCSALSEAPWCADARALLVSARIAHAPWDYVADAVLVVPERMREPYEIHDGRAMLADLEAHANAIYAANEKREESTLYRAVAEYIGCERSRAAQGAESGFTGRRVLVSISKKLSQKTGVLRGHLMGKRVDFSARAVIGGSSSMPPHCIGIPRRIASTVYVTTIVSPSNIAATQALVRDPVAGSRIVKIARIVGPSDGRREGRQQQQQQQQQTLGTPDPAASGSNATAVGGGGTGSAPAQRAASGARQIENIYFRRDAHSRGFYGTAAADETLGGGGMGRATPREYQQRARLEAELAASIGDPALATDAPGLDRDSIDRRSAIALQVGDKIYRELDDGDIVLFGRQPSLHRLSLMGMRCIVTGGHTIKMNQCVCPPYNADFDGDEMNVHVPQGDLALAEAEGLLATERRSLNPASGASAIAAIQDAVVGAAMMSGVSTFVGEREARVLARAAGLDPSVDLPPPAVRSVDVPLCFEACGGAGCRGGGPARASVRSWTGKQVLSLAMTRPDDPAEAIARESRDVYEVPVPCGPPVFHDISGGADCEVLWQLVGRCRAAGAGAGGAAAATTHGRREDAAGADLSAARAAVLSELAAVSEGAPPAQLVAPAPASSSGAPPAPSPAASSQRARQQKGRGIVVRHSQLLCGTLRSDEIGKSKDRGLATAAFKNDSRFGMAFVYRISRIAQAWIARRGFSVGLGEMHVPSLVRAEIEAACAACASRDAVERIDEIASALPERDRPGRASALLAKRYADACQKAQDSVRRAMRPENALAVMCTAGSKGSWGTICATSGSVGQQFESGMPLPRKMHGDRMLTSVVTRDSGLWAPLPPSAVADADARGRSRPRAPGDRGRSDCDPVAHGIVAGSYSEGLTPDETFVHNIGTRDGLTGTALRTKDGGHMMRDDSKLMESIYVAQDGSVRLPRGQIVQASYGGDNIDGMRAVRLAVPLLSPRGAARRRDWLASSAEIAASGAFPGDDAASISAALDAEAAAFDALAESWSAGAHVQAKHRAFGTEGSTDDRFVPTDASVALSECISAAADEADALAASAATAAAARGCTAARASREVDDIAACIVACYGYLASVKLEWLLEPPESRADAAFARAWVPSMARAFVAHVRWTLRISELARRASGPRSTAVAAAPRSVGDLADAGLFALLRNKLVDRTLRAFVAPGEMVGMVCVDSNSEPIMQLALNAFHLAGAFVIVLASGLPRMREITGLTHNQKTPVVFASIRRDRRLSISTAVGGGRGAGSASASAPALVQAGSPEALEMDAEIRYALVGRRMADILCSSSAHGTAEEDLVPPPPPADSVAGDRERDAAPASAWAEPGCDGAARGARPLPQAAAAVVSAAATLEEPAVAARTSDDQPPGASARQGADARALAWYNAFPEPPLPGCILTRAALRLAFRASDVRAACPDSKCEEMLWNAADAACRLLSAAVFAKDAVTGRTPIACDYIGTVSAARDRDGRAPPPPLRAAGPRSASSPATAADAPPQAMPSDAEGRGAADSTASGRQGMIGELSLAAKRGDEARRKVAWMRVANNFGCVAADVRPRSADAALARKRGRGAPETYIAVVRLCVYAGCSAHEREAAEKHVLDRMRAVSSSKRLHALLVSGTAGVTGATFRGADADTPERARWTVVVSGLPGALLRSMVASCGSAAATRGAASGGSTLLDPDTFKSNDINAVEAVYGIEAARRIILDELATVHGADASIESRHLELIADAMTYSGAATPLSAYGDKRGRTALARATHERARQELVRAGLAREASRTDDPSSALILGNREPRCGTCLSDVRYSIPQARAGARAQAVADAIDLSDAIDSPGRVGTAGPPPMQQQHPPGEWAGSGDGASADRAPGRSGVLGEMAELARKFARDRDGGARRGSGDAAADRADAEAAGPLAAARDVQRRSRRERCGEIAMFRTKKCPCFADDSGVFAADLLAARRFRPAPPPRESFGGKSRMRATPAAGASGCACPLERRGAPSDRSRTFSISRDEYVPVDRDLEQREHPPVERPVGDEYDPEFPEMFATPLSTQAAREASDSLRRGDRSDAYDPMDVCAVVPYGNTDSTLAIAAPARGNADPLDATRSCATGRSIADAQDNIAAKDLATARARVPDDIDYSDMY